MELERAVLENDLGVSERAVTDDHFADLERTAVPDDIVSSE